MDKDGDKDFILGKGATMYWFEYKSADSWTKHSIGWGANTDVGGCSFDVDGDGWVDVAAGTGWYRNTQSPQTQSFTYHGDGAWATHDNIAADVNGDGKLDLIGVSDQHGMSWWSIPSDPNGTWTEHVVTNSWKPHGGIAPAGAGDLDGDGDCDLVDANRWYENANGSGTQWIEHVDALVPSGGNRPAGYGLALRSYVYDLNKDGKNDIIQAENDCNDSRVFWWQNNGNKTFTYHLISANSTSQDFHTLDIADFDNDGDMDVFSGGGPLTVPPTGAYKMFIWENTDGHGGTWSEHQLNNNGKEVHEGRVGDVDGDGDGVLGLVAPAFVGLVGRAGENDVEGAVDAHHLAAEVEADETR